MVMPSRPLGKETNVMDDVKLTDDIIIPDAPMEEVVEENPAPTEQDYQQLLEEIKNFKFGYIVGIKEDNTIAMMQAGSKAFGLVEMLGLHGYAGLRLNSMYGELQGALPPQGHAVMFSRIEQMLKVMLNMLTKQAGSNLVGV
jgi:hypothetical protein